MKPTHHRYRPNGFTMLELVISMLLMSLIVGMVFGIARSSLALGNTIVETQNEEMLHQAFFDLLGQRFSAMPGNARMDLKVQDSGTHYLSDLTLQNVPMSFTWGGNERIAKAVQLSTVKKRSGYLDIVLRYYENEILEDAATSFGNSMVDKKPFAEIVLLEDVAYFEWRVLDSRTMEWQYDWDATGRLPLQMELTMAVGAKGEEMRQIFWMPPKMNPEVVMRQYAAGMGGTPGAGSGGQPGGTPVPGKGGTGEIHLQPGGNPVKR